MRAYLRNHPEDFFLSPEEEGEVLAFTAAPIDYRIARSKGVRLRGERLHWALIEGIWDRYWAVTQKNQKTEVKILEEFLAGLTAGQRALLAIKQLDNMVRVGGWRDVVENMVLNLQAVHREILAGYRLVAAKPYRALFKRVVAKSGAWTDALRKVQKNLVKLVKKRQQLGIGPGDPRFTTGSSTFWRLKDRSAELQRNFMEQLRTWRSEYLKMRDSPETSLENLIDSYVVTHPKEFYRD